MPLARWQPSAAGNDDEHAQAVYRDFTLGTPHGSQGVALKDYAARGTRRGALSAKRSKASVLVEKIFSRSPASVIVSSTRSMCSFGLIGTGPKSVPNRTRSAPHISIMALRPIALGPIKDKTILRCWEMDHVSGALLQAGE